MQIFGFEVTAHDGRLFVRRIHQGVRGVVAERDALLGRRAGTDETIQTIESRGVPKDRS